MFQFFWIVLFSFCSFLSSLSESHKSSIYLNTNLPWKFVSLSFYSTHYSCSSVRNATVTCSDCKFWVLRIHIFDIIIPVFILCFLIWSFIQIVSTYLLICSRSFKMRFRYTLGKSKISQIASLTSLNSSVCAELNMGGAANGGKEP